MRELSWSAKGSAERWSMRLWIRYRAQSIAVGKGSIIALACGDHCYILPRLSTPRLFARRLMHVTKQRTRHRKLAKGQFDRVRGAREARKGNGEGRAWLKVIIRGEVNEIKSLTELITMSSRVSRAQHARRETECCTFADISNVPRIFIDVFRYLLIISDSTR